MQTGCRQKGFSLVLVAVLLFLLVALAAFTIDLGHLFERKSAIQVAADSVALAAASALKQGPGAVRARAHEFAVKNGLAILDADIELGRWDPETKSFTLLLGDDEREADAVRITGQLVQERNNAVDLTLAPALGEHEADVRASAIATFGTPDEWDVVILQDVTGSFREEIDEARDADLLLLGCLDSHTSNQSQVGLVVFTGWGRVLASLQPIATGYDNLVAAIQSLNSCGRGSMPRCSGTDIAVGLEIAVYEFDASSTDPEIGKAIVLVSDGKPQSSRYGSHPDLNDEQLADLAIT
ncbi:MAG: vWA domain-containing protein [Planctomycetota bacterium]